MGIKTKFWRLCHEFSSDLLLYYTVFIDSDDLVLEEGIFNSYKYIKKYKIDIVQFHSIWKFQNKIYINKFGYNYKKIIYQPYLSYIFYYNNKKKEGIEYNYALWNKLIKKEISDKTFKWIDKNYIKEKIITHNDLIILFSLLKISNSFKYIDEFGYFYYFKVSQNSASNSWKNYKKSNEIVHGLFTNIKFLYLKTGNSYLDKYFCVFEVHNYYRQYNNLFKYINNKEISYIKEILNILINSDYISKENKSSILLIKSLIINKRRK